MTEARASKLIGQKDAGEKVDCVFALVKAGEKRMPLTTHGGVVLDTDAIADNQIIYISGHDAFLPDVVVRTTMECIRRNMEQISKEEARLTFTTIWNAIKNVNTDELYAEQGERWQDLMDDIVLYYVCRYKIFGTAFPVITS